MLLNSSAPFLLLPSAFNVSNPLNPIVRNPRTRVAYRGTSFDGVEQWQNIFYAEDTSGANRFAPPVPYMPPSGSVVDATAAGAWCPQGTGARPLPFASLIDDVSENCLSLRIARPSGVDASAKLPVLVWMHGGGDILGSASDRLYEPDGLIRQSRLNHQPVIFVGINYRLGIFGFGTNKALIAAKAANNGLRDQRAAFEWVRNNIAAFGGDPSNVIAIGQSVGSSSIALHLTSYGGRRGVPFQKAIMMSGGSGYNFNVRKGLIAQNTATVMRDVGCRDDPDSQAAIDCLRRVPFKTLMDTSVGLQRKLSPPYGELTFYPSWDGDYIPDRPSEMQRKGQIVKGVSIIASWVANDGNWYAPPNLNSDAGVTATFTKVLPGLSKASQQRLMSLYPLSDFNHMVRPDEGATVHYYRAAQINRDLRYTCGVIDFTWQYTRYGGGADVRMYEMNQTKFGPVFKYMGVPEWRVGHLSSIPYILNVDVQAGGDNSPAQKDLSALLSGSAAAFAKTGNPNLSSGRTFRDWPIAYRDHSRQAFAKDQPDSMSVYIIGGPTGSGPANVARIGGGSGPREQALAWEKLFERCSFINSIRDELDV